MKKLIAAALAAPSMLVLADAAAAAEGFDLTKKGIEWESPGGLVDLTLGGRLHIDGVSYESSLASDDQVEARRARLELSGKVGDKVRFRLDREFTDGGGWRGAWISFEPTDNTELRFGNAIAPFSQEDLQSSNATPLMERSLANALAPGYAVGLTGGISGKKWSLTGGVLDDGLADDDGRSRKRGMGAAARVTYAPLGAGKTVVHIGLSAEQREPESGATLRFQSGPEAAFAPPQLRSGNIAGVETLSNLGLELAGRRGPVILQAQYITTNLERSAAPDVTLSGWYVQGSWVIGGRQREYNPQTGLFGAVDPRKSGKTFELAARYSVLEFDDAALGRGVARNVTVGANWYLNDNVRVMANYVRAETSDVPLVKDTQADIFMARFQVSF